MRTKSPRRAITAVIVTSVAIVLAALPQPCAQAQTAKDKSANATIAGTPAKPRIVPGADPGGVAVAIIGSGVNYTLPLIAGRLARDGEGDLIGLDFVDRDNKPFDVLEPGVPSNAARPMGTTLASVLLADAPRARLIPVRIGKGEPKAFGGAAAFVASTPARIAIVAHASANRADWEHFEQAAKTVAAKVLFILPAGDGGRDLDAQPLYPASLQLPNAIVVTAATADGRLLPDANTGPSSVDVAVAADVIPALTVLGDAAEVSGSTFAAARAAAFVARLLHAQSSLTPAEIKERLPALAQPIRGEVKRWTRLGWIAEPQAMIGKGKP